MCVLRLNSSVSVIENIPITVYINIRMCFFSFTFLAVCIKLAGFFVVFRAAYCVFSLHCSSFFIYFDVFCVLISVFYSTFAPTTVAICIILIVCPSSSAGRSVTLPDLLVVFVFLKTPSSFASAVIYLPAPSGALFLVFV